MHILLTDILTCPRCGPEFGLIVLADAVEDRQVMEGYLGCANCRSRYPIAHGIADLRTGGDDRLDLETSPHDDSERGVRTAALLGAQPANSTLLILDGSGENLSAVGELLSESHLVGASVTAREGGAPESGFVSRIVSGARLPFRPASFRGMAILGNPGRAVVDQALRLLAPGSRLVVEGASDEAIHALRKSGAELLLEQDGVVVAATPGRR